MTRWELDFQDVTSVPPEADGKQQHVVEVLNIIDVGTSILVDSVARPDFTAETTLQTVLETFRTEGLPQCVTIDRDPRFVGSPQGRDFPAPFVRLLHCLGVEVNVCAPRRPQQKGFVERYNCQSSRYTTERSSAIVQKYRRHECNHLRAPCRNHLSYAQSKSLAARRTYGWKENPTDGYPQSTPPFAGHHQSE